MSISNNSAAIHPVEMYLRKHDNHYAMRVLPAIIVLSILMLVGFVGNSLVCYVYLFKFKRSTPRYFIVALAVFDLISCTLSIPIEISDMRFHYTFGAYTICRFVRAVVVFSTMSSGTVLLAVAFYRFKKICRPFKIQTTPFMAKVAILLCTISAFIVALPAVFIYGSMTTVSTDGIRVNGSDCSTADEYIDTPYPLMYNVVQFLLFISATITLTVLYSLIWQQSYRQQAFRERTKTSHTMDRLPTPKPQSQECLDTTGDFSSTSFDGLQQDKKIISSPCPDLGDTANDSNLHNKDTNLNGKNIWKKKTSANQIRENKASGISTIPPRRKLRTKSTGANKIVTRTTFMLFLITLVFVVSFFPHLGLMAARALNKDLFKDLEGAEIAAYNLFLRSYFINSASNPIIYSIYNANFRREVQLLFRKFTCRS